MEKKFFCACGSIGHILQVKVDRTGIQFLEHKLEKTGCDGFKLSRDDFGSFQKLMDVEPKQTPAESTTRRGSGR